jgi:hypothetical protein
MLTIYPPIGPCLKFSVKTLGLVLGFVLLLGIVVRYFKDEPFIGFLLVFQLSLFFVGLAVPLGVVLYLILRVWAWSVEPSGLTGRSYWGRRSHIAWKDVDRVGFVAIEGIPALVVTSATSKQEVFAYTLGINIPDVHTHLYRYAGPEHVLTQWFRPAAA